MEQPWYIGARTNLAFGWTVLLLPVLWTFATQGHSEKETSACLEAGEVGVSVSNRLFPDFQGVGNSGPVRVLNYLAVA